MYPSPVCRSVGAGTSPSPAFTDGGTFSSPLLGALESHDFHYWKLFNKGELLKHLSKCVVSFILHMDKLISQKSCTTWPDLGVSLCAPVSKVSEQKSCSTQGG